MAFVRDDDDLIVGMISHWLEKRMIMELYGINRSLLCEAFCEEPKNKATFG